MIFVEKPTQEYILVINNLLKGGFQNGNIKSGSTKIFK